MRTTKYLLILFAALAIGCGDDPTNPGSGDGGTTNMDGATGDGGGGGGDGGTTGDGGAIGTDGGNMSVCGITQCSNCIDDDNDGTIDGFDIECISAADDDEGSFATGIPGDNKDSAKQDCFFDGDSGAGNDGCVLETCCLLGTCPDTDCTVSQQCIDFCAPAAPPGCDCFGCCTICEGADCRDVLINPAISPDCDADTIDDTTVCPTCIKVDSCSTTCDPAGCILCPGQTEDDLPPECNNQNQCPEGQTACESSSECAANEYCGNGCCVEGFIVE